MNKTVDADVRDYKTLVGTFGYRTIAEAHDNKFQGDSLYLLQDGSRVGYLCFGWGSCSGCDALIAASGDIDEMTELYNKLYNSIVWFDTRAEAKNYVKTKDWALSSVNKSLATKFKKAVNNLN